jgi:hypothetical protein
VEPGKSRAARAGLLFEVSNPPRLRPNNGLAFLTFQPRLILELDRRALVLIALTAALAGVGVRLDYWVNLSPALPLLVFLRLLPAIRPIAREGETER